MPTAPTVKTGSRYTTVGISQDRRKIEILGDIAQYDASATPTLAVLSKRAPQVLTGSPKYLHIEDQPLPATTTLNGAVSGATATTIAVAAGTGSYFRAGDLIQFPSAVGFSVPGELAYVSSVSTDTLTVVRNYDGDQTTGGTMSSGDTVQIIGNANAEFATARPIKTTTEATVTNYTQIIRTPYALSATLEGSDMQAGPNDRLYQRQKMATQHALEIERTILFSKPSEKLTTTTPTRTTGGFFYSVTTNTVNSNGTLTWPTVETLLEKCFRYGSKNKLLMVSRKIASQLDLIAEGRIQTTPGETMYGVAMSKLLTAHGTVMTCVNDQLSGANWQGYAALVDLENVKLRYMKDATGNRFGQLRTNIQANDADGFEDEYLSEVGLQLLLESGHGYLYGVS